MDSKKIQAEKKYLNEVKRVLKTIIDEANENIDNRKVNINEMKRFMWDNMSDFTDEERASAMYDVDKDVNITNNAIQRVSKYEKALSNPYFGKVVFFDKEFGKEQDIYIGISSIQKEFKFYVFDWRAPVSSLFYNFELGNAYYEAPSGKINGNILSKMQFKIENGELVRCFNSDINIDDEYLQEILANSSGDKMKNIVSTIQREQNEIIRNDDDKYLIVQGIAGSGKTSVAMHRIAYLLYKNKNLTFKNVLIFSPTDVFSKYISNVLPELGEENVLTSTFCEFARTFFKLGKKIESYTEFLERIYSENYNKEIEYKLSQDYHKDLKDFMMYYNNNIRFNSDIKFGGKIVNTENLKRLFTEKFYDFPVKERLELMAERICYDLNISQKNKGKIISFLKKTSTINFDILDVYNQFLTSKDIKLCEDEARNINYEDINGLLYILFEIEGYPYYPYIKHIVIDEAQDYSMFQMELFSKMFKNASFTILGDVNQTINFYSKLKSLRELMVIFTTAKYIELTKTYRSSEEIIDYSNNILDIENACAIRHNNSLPVDIYSVNDEQLVFKIKNSVNNMVANDIKKIAIITKNCEEAKSVYNKLADNNYQLIEKDDADIHNHIIVIPSYLSKGLEFDGVIVCNLSDNDYKEIDRNLYYVVCTRAQHKLTICNEPKKLIKKKI